MPDHTSGLLQSFPPIADEQSAVLILGSMPGTLSLTRQEYYAHPQNAFWDIMGKLFGAERSLPYAERVALLRRHRVAVWDVLHTCNRIGGIGQQSSLDSHIVDESPNDFAGFFKAHPHIGHVFFNGAKAENSFRKHVMHLMPPTSLRFTRLPSTSPANAGSSKQQKYAAWVAILQALPISK